MQGAATMISEAQALSLRDFYTRVYLVKKRKIRSPNTRRLYENTFNNFERFLGRTPLLSDLTEDNIAGVLFWTLERGRSPDTANKDAGQLLAIANFAFSKGYIESLPEVELATIPKRIPRAWLIEELELLFDSAAKEKGLIGGVRADLWWRAVLLTCFFTGERIGAVLLISWDKVDLERGWILVPAEDRKGGREDKSFPIPAELVEAYRLIQTPYREMVFPWQYSATYIYRKYDKILERAGLPTDRKSKFHRIRKSTASYYKAAGGDATELLGHADPKTTKRYLDPRICGSRNSAEALPSPIKKTF
jgi:integrase